MFLSVSFCTRGLPRNIGQLYGTWSQWSLNGVQKLKSEIVGTRARQMSTAAKDLKYARYIRTLLEMFVRQLSRSARDGPTTAMYRGRPANEYAHKNTIRLKNSHLREHTERIKCHDHHFSTDACSKNVRRDSLFSHPGCFFQKLRSNIIQNPQRAPVTFLRDMFDKTLSRCGVKPTSFWLTTKKRNRTRN